MNIIPLLKWYDLNKRILPWRDSQNPYFIWLSEVILQQTRVDQGLPYFNRITDKYPTIHHLAKAKKEIFFKLWQGLGYYNRAENLLESAKFISKQLNGQFPSTYEELIKLKGIGPYTASAISSIAFNQPNAVLDGNVFRVLSRLYDIHEPIQTSNAKEIFGTIALNLLGNNPPSQYNQAMMELGALICKPTNPLCEICPLNDDCVSLRKGNQSELPVKKVKSKPKTRHINYFILIKGNQTYIRKRIEKNIWKNLYEPPNFDSDKPLEDVDMVTFFLKSKAILNSTNKEFEIKHLYETKHQLTHQTIYAKFWLLSSYAVKKTILSDFIEVPISNINNYPVHRLFDKFLNFHNLQSSITNNNVG